MPHQHVSSLALSPNWRYNIPAARLHSSELPVAEPDDIQPPPAREINEDTPLSSLSQAEIAQLTEKMLNNNPSTRTKLIAEITPILELRGEYLDGAQSFVRQIDWLQAHGFTEFRRTARDGNCFYRSVAFAYLDRLLHAPDIVATVARFREVLASKELGLTLAFEDEIHKEFSQQLEDLISIIENFGAALTTDELLERLLGVCDYVAYYLRLLASAEIRTNPDPYRDFIFDQEIVAFCQSQVEAVDSEADHIAMMALCNALRITLKLATLSSHVQGDVQEADVFTCHFPGRCYGQGSTSNLAPFQTGPLRYPSRPKEPRVNSGYTN
ncbi:cysteine proteinase [Mycena metata]|uniref:ubiquitinyl hydrolase 1 n=1 Tax=Mycena metata TaxID=1033252 RepID=A0AAD7K5B2_9AGAR|nr:cysteine proteinase [Mycena metata]